jgi:hypothetical protein
LVGHPALDLIVTLDDAASAIYSAFLVQEEGTQSSFRGIGEAIERQGLFCELYTDRGSHYFHTPKAGAAVSKTVRTQVGRALAQLGVRHIAAYSPEAGGRSERAFRTLQDRLPKELKLAGIKTLDTANRWIAETYRAQHNAAFAVAPAETGSAFVADRTGQAGEILCLQEECRVGSDNTVRWRGLRPANSAKATLPGLARRLRQQSGCRGRRRIVERETDRVISAAHKAPSRGQQ